MYVNNIRVERISSCCEYKYTKGAKLGTGTIQFLSVEGAAPCFKCNVRRGYLKVCFSSVGLLRIFKNFSSFLQISNNFKGQTGSGAETSFTRIV